MRTPLLKHVALIAIALSSSVGDRLFSVELGIGQSTYGPTATHKKTMEIVNTQLEQIKTDLAAASAAGKSLGEELLAAGAPWIEGSPLPQQE